MKTQTKKFNGKKLRNMRILAGETLEEVSTAAKFDTSSLSLWENGRRPSPHNLKKLSTYFKVPISSFFAALFMLLAVAAHAEYEVNLPAGAHMRIAPHFVATEFACRHCGRAKVSGALLYRLELLRKELGDRKVTVLSGFRCQQHNEEVGGVKHSQHMLGKAADIRVDGLTPAQVARAAKKAGFTFVKTYSTWTHVDVR